MLIAFVPVLHKGYLELFKAHPGKLGILGDDIIADYTALTRDLRVIDPLVMKRAIESLGLFSEVQVLSKKDLAVQEEPIVMPDEDLSRALSQAYFHGKATLVSLFLRWDKMATTNKVLPIEDRRESVDILHRDLMKTAATEAQYSSDWWRQIGALIVKDGCIVAQGHNHHLPTDYHLSQNGDPRSNFDAGERIELSTVIHGEAGLIARCAKQGISVAGASIFVTTFPCPNCARLIAESGITSVYYSQGYSLLDAQQILKAANIDLIFVDLPNTNA